MTCIAKTCKRILTFAIAAATAMTASAGLSIKECFINAPREVIATIDSLTRVEMLLYLEAGSPTPSKNMLDGQARIINLTDDMITFSNSAASEVTIARLPAGRDSVLLVLTTVALPALDTGARMYSSNWTPLPAKMQLPSFNNLNLWLTPEAKGHEADIENIVPFITAKCDFTPSTQTLLITSTVLPLIGKDNYEPIAPYMKDTISYRWTGKKWVLIK